MKYKIGDVAKMLGITPEAIRFYESHGIIKPDKDDNSGYRLYDVWDIHMLIRARSYRQFGYSLSETAKMLNEYNMEDFIGNLDRQDKVIEHEILWRINLLRHIRETKEIVLDANNGVGHYQIRTRPAIFRIETQDAYTIFPDKRTKDNMKKWIDKVPFVYPCALFRFEDVNSESRDGTFTFGLGVDEDYGDFLQLKSMDDIQYFPSVPALYTTIKTDSNEILTTQRLIPAIEELRRKGLSLSGDVLSRVVLMRKEGDVYVSYHQLWLPFEVFPQTQKKYTEGTSDSIV